MNARCITIEGSDGAGKETQTKILAEYLVGWGLKVETISFPRYNQTVGGTLLYQMLKGEDASRYDFSKVNPYVASRFYSEDREESLSLIRNLVESSDVVIFDRYVESNLLHQGGKFNSEKDRIAFAEWLYKVEYEIAKLPRPNDIIYLSLPFWVSRKRAQLRAEKLGVMPDAVECDLDYVKQGYEAGQFYAKHFGWHVIDCVPSGYELSQEEVAEKVLAKLHFHRDAVKAV